MLHAPDRFHGPDSVPIMPFCLQHARNCSQHATCVLASGLPGPAAPYAWRLALLTSRLREPGDASPHVPDVGEEEEELGQAPVLLLKGHACFGHQVDQGVRDLIQHTVDMVLLFQGLQGARQKCVHP